MNSAASADLNKLARTSQLEEGELDGVAVLPLVQLHHLKLGTLLGQGLLSLSAVRAVTAAEEGHARLDQWMTSGRLAAWWIDYTMKNHQTRHTTSDTDCTLDATLHVNELAA